MPGKGQADGRALRHQAARVLLQLGQALVPARVQLDGDQRPHPVRRLAANDGPLLVHLRHHVMAGARVVEVFSVDDPGVDHRPLAAPDFVPVDVTQGRVVIARSLQRSPVDGKAPFPPPVQGAVQQGDVDPRAVGRREVSQRPVGPGDTGRVRQGVNGDLMAPGT